jgi:membrane-bound serine protease (ClpP class)
MGYLYALNRSIMIQKTIIIAQKGSKIIFATEPDFLQRNPGFNINVGAIFLIIIGIGLLILEIKIPGFGIIGFAGFISLIIGSVLFVPTGDENIYTPEFIRLITLTIIVPTIVFGLFLVFAIYKVTEIRKKKPVIGTIIGDTAQTIDPLGPGKSGFVRYNGEYWQARSEEEIGIKEKVGQIKKILKK